MIPIKKNPFKSLKFRHIVIILLALGAVRFLWYTLVEDQIPHIARIEINSKIAYDAKLLAAIEKVEKDNTAKALILAISSPGGSVYGSEAIYLAIQKVKKHKPVIAQVQEMAASGGYLIACASNSIVASGNSIVGSIGVLFVMPQVKPLLDKLGVSLLQIKSSPLKAEPNPFNKASKDSIQEIEKLVNESYRWFVQIVSKSRNLSHNEAMNLSDGRFFSGNEAKKLGLIDYIGGNDKVLEVLYSEWKIDRKITKIKNSNPMRSYWERFSNSSMMEYVLGDFVATALHGSNGLLAMRTYQ